MPWLRIQVLWFYCLMENSEVKAVGKRRGFVWFCFVLYVRQALLHGKLSMQVQIFYSSSYLGPIWCFVKF